MAELHDLTALEQGELVRSGETSAVELTDHYLARIERADRDHGDFVAGAFAFLDPDAGPAAGAGGRRGRAGRATARRRSPVCRPRSRTST